MNIIFYKLQDEVNDVKKTRTITATSTYTLLTISGKLRSSTSKIAPVIDFAQDITYFNTYNYAYIADFGRYYFVDNVVSVRENVTSISFRVDVLTSFLTQSNMGNLEGYIGRCANSSLYDKYINDRMVQFKNSAFLSYGEPTSLVSNIENITFDISTTLTKNVVMSTYTREVDNILDNTNPMTSLSVPSALSDLTKTTSIYIDMFQTRSLCDCWILNDSSNDIIAVYDTLYVEPNRAELIYNIVCFPFTIPNLSDTKSDVKIDTKVVPELPFSGNTLQAYRTKSFNSGFLVLKDFILSMPSSGMSTANFIAREPYTTCEIFIPFASWVKIDIKQNLGSRLMVMYNVNYLTGDATVYLYNHSHNIILYQATVQLGVQWNISVTNAKENQLKDQNYQRNFIMGMLGGLGMTALGIATSNPALVGGGAVGIGKSSFDFVNNENLLIEHANVNVSNSSGTSGMFGGLKVLVKWIQQAPVTFTGDYPDSFIKHFGVPTNKLSLLSAIPVSGNYHTYAEITDLHTTSEAGTYSIADITIPETEELKSLCSQGIYL